MKQAVQRYRKLRWQRIQDKAKVIQKFCKGYLVRTRLSKEREQVLCSLDDHMQALLMPHRLDLNIKLGYTYKKYKKR